MPKRVPYIKTPKRKVTRTLKAYIKTPKRKVTRTLKTYIKTPKRKVIRPLKTYIKFLAICRDATNRQRIVNKAPNNVIKAISNAALNVARGDVHLSPAQRALLNRYKSDFIPLIERKTPLAKKRKVLSQKGGLAILPVILSSVLSALGSTLFK